MPITIAIVPNRRLAAGVGRLEVLPLSDALGRDWPTEAGFVTYFTLEERSWPRLKKDHLKLVREAGGTVLVSCLVLDYDRPHEEGQKWPWRSLEEAEDFLAGLALKALPWPTAAYSTKHGLRLIYELEQPLAPETSEAAYRGLLDLFQEQGIPMDRSTSDWTRVFFLPRIVKDGENLAQLPYLFVEEFDSAPLDGMKLSASADVAPIHVLHLSGDRPDSAAADALLMTGRSHTAFYRAAKERLGKGSDAPWLFENQPVPFQIGERNTEMFKLVGRVTTRLWDAPTASPEHIYALLRNGVAQMPIESGDKDPCEVLWEQVQRTWEKRHEQSEVQRVTLEEHMASMVAGFRDQCRKSGESLAVLAESVGQTELDYMRSHMIVTTGRGGYLMDGKGRYFSQPLPMSGIHNRIASMGLGDVYGIHDRSGELLSEQKLMSTRGAAVSRIQGTLGIRHAELREIGKPEMFLAVPTSYLREDIPPVYSREVDEFLQQFAGRNYDRLVDWLGHALDIRKPICALSLSGVGGAGKSLLAEIIGACFGPGGKNSHEVLTTNFNGGLTQNPLVHIDEELPSARHVDALLRTYVSGGNLAITKKGVDSITNEVYPRVLFTANNLEALRTALGSRDLDDASHDALASRIHHMGAMPRAAQWFKDHGGRQMTSQWITGDALAVKHMMFLHMNRRRPSIWAGSGRFLVEGEKGSQVIEQMRYQTSGAQSVITALVQALRSMRQGGAQVVTERGGEYWVTSFGLHTYMQHGMDNDKMSITDVGDILRKVAVEARSESRVRSFRLKMDVLTRFAHDCGLVLPQNLRKNA